LSYSANTLTTLKIGGMGVIRSLDPLRHLTNLASLDLAYLVDIDPIQPCFEDLTALKWLALPMSATETFDSLRSTRLQTLLTSLSDANNELCDSISKLRSLHYLQFHVNDDTLQNQHVQCLSALCNLEYLDIYSISITASAFNTLSHIEGLKTVQMYCPRLRRDQVVELLPNVEVFH
jgi:hypothetical protein